mmetsp:Transcript_58965/g.105167  ORF Transcript_58965/g.105167 Transcript_58965/m.105167 type:complete len:252 (-) Transcript_58965:480-1235(-)
MSEISSVLWDDGPSQETGGMRSNPHSNDGFFNSDYSAPGQSSATMASGGRGSFNAPPATYNPPFNEPYGGSNFDEAEKPLLEELGIDFAHIKRKVTVIINPFKHCMDAQLAQDADLAGPFFFTCLLGCLLLLTGKVHFGYIFGMGVTGCVFLWALLNVMCEKAVELQYTISVLGYCLCPTIVLGFWRIVAVIGLNFVPWWLSWPTGITMIGWSSFCATKMFVDGLGMAEQKWLILYPVTLLYSTFALISIF